MSGLSDRYITSSLRPPRHFPTDPIHTPLSRLRLDDPTHRKNRGHQPLNRLGEALHSGSPHELPPQGPASPRRRTAHPVKCWPPQRGSLTPRFCLLTCGARNTVAHKAVRSQPTARSVHYPFTFYHNQTGQVQVRTSVWKSIFMHAASASVALAQHIS